MALPSLVSGAALFGLRQALASRNAQGERIGKLEKWIDREEGRRQGFKEAREELAGSDER